MDVDVADLVRDAQRGDVLAMGRLLDVLAPYVGRICGAIAFEAGQDAAQETLLIVFRRLGTLRDPAALYGWVRTIAVRESLRAARTPADPSPLLAPAARPSPSGSPEELLAGAETASDVRRVLERLPPEQRAVLVLRDVHGIDEAEAARLLAVARGTVKSRLHRARARFRREWTG